jgi:hypothetical protein
MQLQEASGNSRSGDPPDCRLCSAACEGLEERGDHQSTSLGKVMNNPTAVCLVKYVLNIPKLAVKSPRPVNSAGT